MSPVCSECEISPQSASHFECHFGMSWFCRSKRQFELGQKCEQVSHVSATLSLLTTALLLFDLLHIRLSLSLSLFSIIVKGELHSLDTAYRQLIHWISKRHLSNLTNLPATCPQTNVAEHELDSPVPTDHKSDARGAESHLLWARRTMTNCGHLPTSSHESNVSGTSPGASHISCLDLIRTVSGCHLLLSTRSRLLSSHRDYKANTVRPFVGDLPSPRLQVDVKLTFVSTPLPLLPAVIVRLSFIIQSVFFRSFLHIRFPLFFTPSCKSQPLPSLLPAQNTPKPQQIHSFCRANLKNAGNYVSTFNQRFDSSFETEIQSELFALLCSKGDDSARKTSNRMQFFLSLSLTRLRNTSPSDIFQRLGVSFVRH
jgi:hypothetical protein